MKTYLLYGFLMALAGFLFTLVLFICGLQSDAAGLASGRWIAGLGSFAIAATLMVLAIRSRRSALPPEAEFSYGRAWWAGEATQLFASGFGVIATYLYAAVINPQISDLLLQAQTAQVEARGRSMSSDQLAVMQHLFSPLGQAIFGFFLTLFFGTIIALIAAAFLRRTGAQDPNAI